MKGLELGSGINRVGHAVVWTIGKARRAPKEIRELLRQEDTTIKPEELAAANRIVSGEITDEDRNAYRQEEKNSRLRMFPLSTGSEIGSTLNFNTLAELIIDKRLDGLTSEQLDLRVLENARRKLEKSQRSTSKA